MAVQNSVATKWKEITKNPIVEAYGLTETSPGLCCNPIGGSERIGTVGLPIPSTDIKILDEMGKETSQGEAGEICAKGPQIMKGYWEKPDETKDA